MEIDYTLISQLKIPEVITYLQQKTKSQQSEKKTNHNTKKSLYILQNIGNEFYIFLLIILIIGIYSTSIVYLISVVSCLIFLVINYIRISKILHLEEKLNILHLSKVKVIRDDKIFLIPENELKIGDIILFSSGEKIPCDIRVIESNTLVVDESRVFGENRKVGKSATTLPKKEFKIYELSNIIFANSLIIKGNGKGIVINTKPINFNFYKTLLKEKNLFHTISTIILSTIAGLLILYITKDIILSITLAVTIIFLTSYKHIELSKVFLKYLSSNKLLSDGIILPSINKLEELKEIQRTIIKIDQTSFDILKPEFFFIDSRKSFSPTELLLFNQNIPQELIYCFIITLSVYSKTKDIQTRIVLNSIINSLSSLGIENFTKNCKIIESNISNNLDSLSTIKVRNSREISISIISLKSYYEKFGTIIPTKTNNGIVILTKEENISNSSIEPKLVITFEKYPHSITNELKFFIISEMNNKDILKHLEAINIDTSKILIAKYEDIINIPNEQKYFLIEKFQILSDIPHNSISYISRLLERENETTIDSFIEIKNSDLGMMKIPYFGTFFSKNNLILTTSNTLLAPFILKSEVDNLYKKLHKTSKLNKFLSLLSITIVSLFLLYNNPVIIPFVPIIPILINSKITHYTISSLDYDNKGNKDKS